MVPQRGETTSVSRALGELPAVLRWGVIGAVIAGCIGGVVGLGLGLSAHPPTAWFAVLEVGIPSAVVGTWLGLTAWCMALIVKRVRDRTHTP